MARVEVRAGIGDDGLLIPLEVRVEGRWLRVLGIGDRWDGAEGRTFRVRTEDGAARLLGWSRLEDRWRLLSEHAQDA